MHSTPDNILTKKLIQGNKPAFDSLFFKYYKPLYKYAYNFCKSDDIAEESVQNTFVKIWKNCTSLKPDTEIDKLLFTYTKNEVIDEIRKVNTRRKYEGQLVSELIINENTDFDNQNKIKAIIESAIDQLPKKSKEIFRLAKQEGLSINEIAIHLNISKKTVENQLSNAYKKMRTYLNPYKNQLVF